MKNYSSLIVGFALTILLSSSLGAFSLYYLSQISSTVTDIYEHPFAVSNAGQSIESHILAMHRDMKDVVLLTDETQLPTILKNIDSHERAVIREFNVIFDRFLGDKAEITKTYQTFLDWRPIRSEVLTLYSLGQKEEAIAITKLKGADHVKRLQAEVREFVLFAKAKAEHFYQQAEDKRKSSLFILSLIALISVVGISVIGFIVVRSKRKADREMAQQNHLVDQNIMMATLDLQGNVLKISNALCRFLQLSQKDILQQQSYFFENTSNRSQVSNSIFGTVETGKAWHGEICRIGSDGVQYFASSTVLPNFNEKFEIVGYTNILQDATSKKLSVMDKLTTLHNRRAFEEIFEREVRLAKRNDSALTLAILDVDFFKKYNDNYGHPQGDVALKQVGQILNQSLNRPNDYVFRIGGEEFAILLCDQSRSQSQKMLDSIRVAIESAHIKHEYSTVSDYLTISVGAFVYSGMSDTEGAEIYNEADKALYLAKETRNTVVVSGQHEFSDAA